MAARRAGSRLTESGTPRTRGGGRRGDGDATGEAAAATWCGASDRARLSVAVSEPGERPTVPSCPPLDAPPENRTGGGGAAASAQLSATTVNASGILCAAARLEEKTARCSLMQTANDGLNSKEIAGRPLPEKKKRAPETSSPADDAPRPFPPSHAYRGDIDLLSGRCHASSLRARYRDRSEPAEGRSGGTRRGALPRSDARIRQPKTGTNGSLLDSFASSQ